MLTEKLNRLIVETMGQTGVGDCRRSVELEEGRDGICNVGQDKGCLVMEEVMPDFVVYDAVCTKKVARGVSDGDFCEGY